MISSNDILEYLKKEISDYLNLGESRYEVEFYNEFSINSRSEIEFILKTLPGTITNNRLVYPVQIIGLIPNLLIEDVKNRLTEFTINKNEDIFEIENKSQKIKQFFSTPTIIEAFNGGQDDYYSTLTIEASFIIFDGAIFSNDCYVKIDNELLKGVINITDSCSKSCDTSVVYTNPMVKNSVNGIQFSLSIDLDFIKNDSLHQKLIINQRKIQTYDVIYFDGYIEHKLKMILVEISKTISQGSTMQGRISLLETIGA